MRSWSRSTRPPGRWVTTTSPAHRRPSTPAPRPSAASTPRRGTSTTTGGRTGCYRHRCRRAGRGPRSGACAGAGGLPADGHARCLQPGERWSREPVDGLHEPEQLPDRRQRGPGPPGRRRLPQRQRPSGPNQEAYLTFTQVGPAAATKQGLILKRTGSGTTASSASLIEVVYNRGAGAVQVRTKASGGALVDRASFPAGVLRRRPAGGQGARRRHDQRVPQRRPGRERGRDLRHLGRAPPAAARPASGSPARATRPTTRASTTSAGGPCRDPPSPIDPHAHRRRGRPRHDRSETTAADPASAAQGRRADRASRRGRVVRAAAGRDDRPARPRPGAPTSRRTSSSSARTAGCPCRRRPRSSRAPSGSPRTRTRTRRTGFTTYIFGFANASGLADDVQFNLKNKAQHSAPLFWAQGGARTSGSS